MFDVYTSISVEHLASSRDGPYLIASASSVVRISELCMGHPQLPPSYRHRLTFSEFIPP